MFLVNIHELQNNTSPAKQQQYARMQASKTKKYPQHNYLSSQLHYRGSLLTPVHFFY